MVIKHKLFGGTPLKHSEMDSETESSLNGKIL